MDRTIESFTEDLKRAFAGVGLTVAAFTMTLDTVPHGLSVTVHGDARRLDDQLPDSFKALGYTRIMGFTSLDPLTSIIRII